MEIAVLMTSFRLPLSIILSTSHQAYSL